MDTVVTDAGGKKLTPGDRVKLYGYVTKDRAGRTKLHHGRRHGNFRSGRRR